MISVYIWIRDLYDIYVLFENTENKMSLTFQIPPEYICPITMDIFKDPVIATDGHTYDRSAIETWFKNNSTSPKTGLRLASKLLIPNFTLRALIISPPKHPTQVAAPKPKDVMCAKGWLEAVHSEDTTIFKVRVVNQPFSVGGETGWLAANEPCKPLRIHFSIDNSGSMGASAEKPGTLDEERTGFSLLDVAMTGLKLAIKSAPENTCISVDSFSGMAKSVLKATSLTAYSRPLSLKSLHTVSPGGCTNLWGALKSSFESCRGEDGAVIFILTDGVPSASCSPSRGILNAFETLIDGTSPLPMFNFLAFGSAPDVKLLAKLAECTGGQVYQIPESSFIGTVFTNALANTFTRFVSSAQILVKDDIVVRENVRVKYGTIVAVQDRKRSPISLRLSSGMKLTTSNYSVGDDEVKFHLIRVQFINHIERAIKIAEDLRSAGRSTEPSCSPIEALLPEVKAKILTMGSTNTFRLDAQAIVDDIENPDGTDGQVLMALRNYYNDWGAAYVLSLFYAHRYQERNNFLDKGTQCYNRGPVAKECDRIADIYDNMPPPKGSIYIGTPTALSAAHSMSAAGYSTHFSGGCFSGECLVMLLDGFKRVDEVKIGDIVYDPITYNAETVQGVFKIQSATSRFITGIKKLRTTPYHPIFHSGSWKFPIDICESRTECFEPVYDFLTSGSAIIVSDTICCTWGHGIKGEVIGHDFFGSRQAIKTTFPGWKSGTVCINNDFFTRDEKSGRINGYCHN
jgi:hypothetical protein